MTSAGREWAKKRTVLRVGNFATVRRRKDRPYDMLKVSKIRFKNSRQTTLQYIDSKRPHLMLCIAMRPNNNKNNI